MIHIAPTITAASLSEYEEQLRRIRPFARRIHIDLMDGEFAPTKSLGPEQIRWPAGVQADLHVMYQRPSDHIDRLVVLRPQLVIVHAEAEGDFLKFAATLHKHGIKAGVALLPETPVSAIAPAIDVIDHVLIFSGNLGHQGGSKADPALLPKIAQLKSAKPSLEIGWDGGINDRNAAALMAAGVDVLNVGGFIQHAHDPGAQYEAIQRALRER